MSASQLLIVDEDRDRAWALGPPVSIGRAKDNTIVVEDPRVAARHALIEPSDGGFRLLDLGSRDGTFVRGRRVREAALLEGDEIVVGLECFRISRAAAVGERELAKLRACLAVSRCIGSDVEADGVLERILSTLGEVLPIDRAAVVLIDANTRMPSRRTTWTRDQEAVPPISTTMLREALASTKGVVVNDIAMEPRFTRSESLRAQGVLSVACLPLRHCGEDFGVLYVDSHRALTPFDRSDLELLSALAAQCALVVRNALLREALLARTHAAEHANAQKTQFLRNMSHELRTPLNGVVGFAELLRSGMAGPLSTTQAEFVGDILSSAHHIVAVITELIDLNTAESGLIKLELAPVSVRHTLDEVCKSIAPIAAAGDVTVGVFADESIDNVFVDPTRLRQVIYNFVANAIKFTPPGGRVDVRALSEGPEAFRIEVEDTGIGIHSDDLARVFVDAVQLEQTRKFPGAGLGLVLTRRIVEAHGGRVGVQSVRGHGSVFYAVFPRCASGAA